MLHLKFGVWFRREYSETAPVLQTIMLLSLLPVSWGTACADRSKLPYELCLLVGLLGCHPPSLGSCSARAGPKEPLGKAEFLIRALLPCQAPCSARERWDTEATALLFFRKVLASGCATAAKVLLATCCWSSAPGARNLWVFTLSAHGKPLPLPLTPHSAAG